VFIHGGFEHENPNIPIILVNKIDSNKLFANFPNLKDKISPKTVKTKVPDATKLNVKKNQTFYSINDQQEFKLANQAHIAMSVNPGNNGQ